MDTDVLNAAPRLGREQSRTASDSSLNTSSEQLALTGFAHCLFSTAINNEPGIADKNDVHKEARLLMSLSCSSPTNIPMKSGRITPPSDASSCYSTASQRDSFTFSCPSLSLENHSEGFEDTGEVNDTEETSEKSAPAALLGRVLKVDDKDALRLSSEAMARNIMQSYQKAIEWRMRSWVDSLSRNLVNKENILKEQNASEESIKDLVNSGEAKLVVKLREISKKIQVLDACTSFKVLPQRVPNADEGEPTAKRQRVEEEEEQVGLEEGEYQYHVAHLLTLEGYMNIFTPGAGHVQIDLQVPGTMKGTFLSIEDDAEQLTDVMIDLNTDILASMIEKSSRMVVRASVEALLKEEPEATEEATEMEEEKVEFTEDTSPLPTFTPKRKISAERVSGLVVITPRDTSSPSSYGDSDNEDKLGILSIPNDFRSDQPKLKMLTPQPSRARGVGNIAFTTRLSKKVKPLPNVVTPHKTSTSFVEAKGKGPSLPTLIEAACAVSILRSKPGSKTKLLT
jgi:hypothetical protein